MSQGETEAEARRNIENAMIVCVNVIIENSINQVDEAKAPDSEVYKTEQLHLDVSKILTPA